MPLNEAVQLQKHILFVAFWWFFTVYSVLWSFIQAGIKIAAHLSLISAYDVYLHTCIKCGVTPSNHNVTILGPVEMLCSDLLKLVKDCWYITANKTLIKSNIVVC